MEYVYQYLFLIESIIEIIEIHFQLTTFVCNPQLNISKTTAWT